MYCIVLYWSRCKLGESPYTRNGISSQMSPTRAPKVVFNGRRGKLHCVLHEMLGPVFDLKKFYSELTKILNEYKKRIDVELAFFYWTGSKIRYKDFELPSFNKPSGNGVTKRLDKVHLSRQSDPGVFVANRNN